MRMKLREIAHSRAGDKGDVSNVSLIVYDLKHYPEIERQVDSRRVAEWFAEVVKGPVERYEMPQARRAELRDARRVGRRRAGNAVAGSPRQEPELVAAGDGDRYSGSVGGESAPARHECDSVSPAPPA